MSLDAKKLKIRENKTDGSLNFARFALTYKVPETLDQSRQNSFEILSLLKCDKDVIIEINSSLFSVPENRREMIVMDFIDNIRSLGLEYRYRKVAATGSQSILTLLFGKKNNQAHEVLVYVPHNVWVQESFKSALPLNGARYFVVNESLDAAKALEDMDRMMDYEKIRFFPMVIFDAGMLGSMGINSQTLQMSDIKKLLGI